ncbi:coiled-coil domain-containing protein 22 [Triplophysa dalaica]|uniref:coiled-coil domain-containing protein 22 n=1 Tax=Triplophysa dalaica TaxID=1582913 RepID=UPI0024DF6BDB|nr:coiled-coil domain-containing protein 22 [Triplophysa dalaica]
MEEVDRILIHSLRQVGTDIDEDVQSVKQFTSELIVEAVVRCLRVIDPSVGNGLSHSLPPGMSARFRLGMSLAQACQDVGFKERLATRHFFTAMNQRSALSSCFWWRSCPERVQRPRTSLPENLCCCRKQLLLKLKLNCQCLGSLRPVDSPFTVKHRAPAQSHHFHVQRLSLPYSVKVSTRKQPKEMQEYWRNYLLPVTAQPSQHASVPASLLENHVFELSAAQEWESEWNSQGLLSRLTPEDYRARKKARLHKRIEEQLRVAAQPRTDTHGATRSTSDLTELLQSFSGVSSGRDVLTKGTRFTHTEKFTFTEEPEKAAQQMAAAASALPSSHQSEEDLKALQEAELSALQQQLQQLSVQMEEVGGDIKLLTVSIQQVSDEVNQREVSNAEKENSVKMKNQTIDLLPDAENNLLKLQSVVEASSKRVVNLASQWEKHRVPLIDEHRRLKELCSNREFESSRKLTEIKGLHEKIRQSAEEAKKKESLYKQLLTEYETLSKDVCRSAYTMRILEIVGNIKKQKEEITKILSDTKELQKEINGLTGKLDRTFAVTDELVFKDAKKDESVRKSYKYLAALHENCTQLIQTIEDTGTIMREIRDLEEQIETENGKRTVSNLEKILEDYKAIRQENSALAAKIRDG